MFGFGLLSRLSTLLGMLMGPLADYLNSPGCGWIGDRLLCHRIALLASQDLTGSPEPLERIGLTTFVFYGQGARPVGFLTKRIKPEVVFRRISFELTYFVDSVCSQDYSHEQRTPMKSMLSPVLPAHSSLLQPVLRKLFTH